MERLPKQRSPHQMGVLLIKSVWDIFKKVWTQRDEILHNTDSYTSRAEATSEKNGYYDTNDLKQIYFHQTASSVTQKLS